MEGYISLKTLTKELGLTNAGRIKLLWEKSLIPAPEMILGRLVYSLEVAEQIKAVFASRKPYQR